MLRGPASAIYGSDAVGGVVQVFTARPPGTAGGPRRGPGNLGIRKLDAAVTAAMASLTIALSAALDRSGFNATLDVPGLQLRA